MATSCTLNFFITIILGQYRAIHTKNSLQHKRQAFCELVVNSLNVIQLLPVLA